MQAPRLNVGYVGKPDLVDDLKRVGHHVEFIRDRDVAPYDLIVIDEIGWAVSTIAEGLAGTARRGQMVLHTALGYGVQVLDPFEVKGAVVMNAHRVWRNHWVGSAADEVGESVLNLLISEIGGNLNMIEDSQRPAILAGERMRAMNLQVNRDAFEILRDHIPSMLNDVDEFWGPPGEPTADGMEVHEVEPIYNAIEDPNAAVLFAALERRFAARHNRTDTEMWAMGKWS